MSNLAIDYNEYNKNNSNIIVYDFKSRKKAIEKDAEDNGSYDNRAGKKCEVYAFRTEEEIKKMIDIYDSHIANAANGTPKRLACRNKMLFVVGINIGIRASDLRLLTWDFFFEKNQDGELVFRNSYNLRPRKTQKTGKYVNLYFNDTVKKVVSWYIGMYPIDDLNGYVFQSRKGDEPITVNCMWRVIKDAAKEAGIKQSIGSHTLRKTFGRFTYMNAKDKTQALIILQKIFRHSSPATTMTYIGLMEDEVESAFDGLNLGIDFI